jgi:cobalt/nickel transport system permease protein
VNASPFSTPSKGGWIAACDPRLRVSAAVVFAAVTVSLSTPRGALSALVLAGAMAAASGWGLRQLLLRLVVIEMFMSLLLVTLPFTMSGEAFVTIGPLSPTREGLLSALMILLKANAVVLALLALVGSLEPVVYGHALARLGVPHKLVHLLLMTVGQIHLLHRELLRLRQAMRARAFVPRSDRHTWRSYGHLVGMLLVRSMDRSRRVLAAMRCRGFHGRLYLLDCPAWQPRDTGLAVTLALLLAGVAMLDRLP